MNLTFLNIRCFRSDTFHYLTMTIRVRYDDQGIFTNKTVMMANFEEWIKMATDNKINSRNSWNFALIDYFHDLNVLKDAEDNINFQKASATLDGCVKIYSSRVDSIANETGKLLSGLADRKDKDINNAKKVDANQDSEDLEVDPLTGLVTTSNESNSNKKRRTYNRVLETTLVDFEVIKMKELDQELSIDPLFKKALADFDEGGAKSLLVNTLSVDNNLRIVFDATSNEQMFQGVGLGDCAEGVTHDKQENTNDTQSMENSISIDKSLLVNITQENEQIDDSMMLDNTSFLIESEIIALGAGLLDIDRLSSDKICPSMQQLKTIVQNSNKVKYFTEDINSKYDNFLTEKDLQEAISENMINQDEIDYNLMNHDELFNEELESQNEDVIHQSMILDKLEQSNSNTVPNTLGQDLLGYFDESLKKNWRGREHWKVLNFKKKIKQSEQSLPSSGCKNKEEEKKKRLQKQSFQINFFDLDDDVEEIVFIPKKGSIEMPKKLRQDKSHYLLPDDYQFSTKRMMSLFINTEKKMSFFSYKKQSDDHQPDILESDLHSSDSTHQHIELADEKFWAKNYQEREKEKVEDQSMCKDSALNQELKDISEDLEIDFNQAFEDNESLVEFNDVASNQSNFITQNWPKNEEKMAYSRTSKKVDVRKLKNNIWKSITALLEEKNSANNEPHQEADMPLKVQLKLTDIIEVMNPMYSEKSRSDLSTSFCFICLLHLANEHGFKIENTSDFDDLIVIF